MTLLTILNDAATDIAANEAFYERVFAQQAVLNNAAGAFYLICVIGGLIAILPQIFLAKSRLGGKLGLILPFTFLAFSITHATLMFIADMKTVETSLRAFGSQELADEIRAEAFRWLFFNLATTLWAAVVLFIIYFVFVAKRKKAAKNELNLMKARDL